MATRSRIGYELSDGSILSIYCHWDGYPEFNGVKLKEHFNTVENVKELIDLGDISCLWTNAGWNNETLPETGPLAYSQRGEDCPPRLDKDLNEYLSNNEEYAYVFSKGKWVCYSVYGNEHPDILKEIEIPQIPVSV